MSDEDITYLLVDGENIDATLGMSVLGRRPQSDERPRWDRVLSYIAQNNYGKVKALFFLNASDHIPMAFVQALLAMDYRPVPLASTGDEKVVDVGIQRTLETIADSDSGNVILASHDGDFEPQLRSLLEKGRTVTVIGFEEFLSNELRQLTDYGLKIIDLEREIKAFNTQLPRVGIITLDTFDPIKFL